MWKSVQSDKVISVSNFNWLWNTQHTANNYFINSLFYILKHPISTPVFLTFLPGDGLLSSWSYLNIDDLGKWTIQINNSYNRKHTLFSYTIEIPKLYQNCLGKEKTCPKNQLLTVTFISLIFSNFVRKQ